MVGIVRRSLDTPAGNLALDDLLLHEGREVLRIWESPVPFIVLGRSGREEQEVYPEACASAGVPVLRRSSGGGTVLQGPGCLNYALILSLDRRPGLYPVAESYTMLLGWVARALAVAGMAVSGSDLLLGARKVSGSAQRRTRGRLLHHGTLLYAPDLDLMARCLREPVRQPLHRQGRTHREFVGGLPLTREELEARLAAAGREFPIPLLS